MKKASDHTNAQREAERGFFSNLLRINVPNSLTAVIFLVIPIYLIWHFEGKIDFQSCINMFGIFILGLIASIIGLGLGHLMNRSDKETGNKEFIADLLIAIVVYICWGDITFKVLFAYFLALATGILWCLRAWGKGMRSL